jgi:hypothetical protein
MHEKLSFGIARRKPNSPKCRIKQAMWIALALSCQFENALS